MKLSNNDYMQCTIIVTKQLLDRIGLDAFNIVVSEENRPHPIHSSCVYSTLLWRSDVSQAARLPPDEAGVHA